MHFASGVLLCNYKREIKINIRSKPNDGNAIKLKILPRRGITDWLPASTDFEERIILAIAAPENNIDQVITGVTKELKPSND